MLQGGHWPLDASLSLSLSEHPFPRCTLPCPQPHSCPQPGPSSPHLGGLLWAGCLLAAGVLTLTGALPRAPTAWRGLSRGHRKSFRGWPWSRTSEDKMHSWHLLEREASGSFLLVPCISPDAPLISALRGWVDAADPQRGPVGPQH